MNEIYIGKTIYKVSDFVSWQRAGRLELSPSFQRRPVWKPKQKSFLIDTVLRGLPTPVIYIRERDELAKVEAVREVVDGQQRLRTLFSFIDESLLQDFNPAVDRFQIAKKHNPALAGATFRKLSLEDQRQIMNYEFSTHILPASTSDRDVLQIFARINSSGTALNKQEVRNAEFFGEFKVTVYDIARSHLQRWRDWGIFDEFQIARMEEVDLCNDLIMMMHYGVRGRSQSATTSFYREHEDEYAEGPVVSERFDAVIAAIDRQIGSLLPGSPMARQAMFYAVFALYYDEQYGLSGPLRKRRPKPIRNLKSAIDRAARRIESRTLDDDLAKALRGATTDTGSRQTRLRFLRAQLRAKAK